MNISHLTRRLSPNKMLIASVCLLGASVLLIWLHAQAVRDMREVGLPTALQLPVLEKRKEILAEQNEIVQLQASLRGGSTQEMARVYSVPAEDDIDRLLATIDVLFSYLEQKRMLQHFSAVTVGEREVVEEGLYRLPVSFEAIVSEEGLSQLMRFMELSGLLIISDALTQEDIDAMLALTEQENPASVAALEHFLSTDLLRYSEEPKPYEEQLRTSFSPAMEGMLRTMLDTPHLRYTRELLGDLAPIIRRQNLWPLRLLTVEQAAYEPGEGRVKVVVGAYVRGPSS